jgi:hypothetical protein
MRTLLRNEQSARLLKASPPEDFFDALRVHRRSLPIIGGHH